MSRSYILRRRIKICAALISILLLYLNMQYLADNNPIMMAGKASTGFLDMTLCIDEHMSFSPISYLNASENVPFTYDLNITNETSYATVIYNTNTNLFTINRTTGLIQFTPTPSQIGSYQINVTARNDACSNNDTSIVFTLNINSLNHAPSLNMSDQVLTQDVPYIYNVSQNATDLDGDPLKFYDNTPLFVIGEDSGIIAFTPTNDQVGVYTVRIYVVDSHNALGYQDVKFTINNVNDPPVLSLIGSQTSYIDEPWNYTFTATDVDAGEQLTFSSNYSNFFASSGGISTVSQSASYYLGLATNWTSNGTYWINVTVTDLSGAEDSEVISYTILYRNHPPNITQYSPTSATLTLTQNSNQEFNITASDPDGTTPSAQWYVNDAPANVTDYNYTYSANTPGKFNITAVITDGEFNDSQSWIVTVIPAPVPAGPPTLAGGGGGGGGFCSELWVCTDWSPCQASNVQLRECEDFMKCGTVKNKPSLLQNCIFVEHPSCFDGVKDQNEVLPDCGGVCKPCPSCNDGIQNQGETGIDCGGPCPACQHLEVPQMLSRYRDRLITPLQIFTYPNESWIFWALLPIMIFVMFRTAKLFAKKTKHKDKAPKYDKTLEEIENLVKVTEYSMNKQDYPAAKAAYSKINKLYGQLPAKDKEQVYEKISKLSK